MRPLPAGGVRPLAFPARLAGEASQSRGSGRQGSDVCVQGDRGVQPAQSAQSAQPAQPVPKPATGSSVGPQPAAGVRAGAPAARLRTAGGGPPGTASTLDQPARAQHAPVMHRAGAAPGGVPVGRVGGVRLFLRVFLRAPAAVRRSPRRAVTPCRCASRRPWACRRCGARHAPRSAARRAVRTDSGRSRCGVGAATAPRGARPAAAPGRSPRSRRGPAGVPGAVRATRPPRVAQRCPAAPVPVAPAFPCSCKGAPWPDWATSGPAGSQTGCGPGLPSSSDAACSGVRAKGDGAAARTGV